MVRKIWNIKAAILAFEIAFFFCFFLGIFVNSGKESSWIERYEGQYHYYINRGYPIPWAGISASDKRVDLPVVKAPFVTYSRAKIYKIIDLSIFLPFFVVSFLFFYCLPSYIFARATDENKKLMPFLYGCYAFFFILGIFVYYFLFPRV